MSKARRFITAGGTLVCALGIGYFMQAGASAPVAGAGIAAAPKLPDTPADTPVEINRIELTSAIASPPSPVALPSAPVTLAVAKDRPLDIPLPSEDAAPGFSCDHDMQANPGDAAMVEVTLTSPCNPNARFTLHHNGMMVTAVTDDHGYARITVPALSASAVFIASFETGEGALATADVDSLDRFDRYVVQWRGQGGMHVHAMEYDAGFGETGHVWAQARHDPARAARGEGGFLTRLGAQDLDRPLMAEIYTFPSGSAARQGAVRLAVEAEVTEANCGRDVEAQSMFVSTGATPEVHDIVLAMPDCDGIGDFLVLKNLFDDLKIASK